MTGAQRASSQFALTNRDKALLTGFTVILQIKGNQASLLRYPKPWREPASLNHRVYQKHIYKSPNECHSISSFEN